MEAFARVPGRSDDFEDKAQREAIDRAVGGRRRSTRIANLGTFTGYRIGLDIGNGNIGWCILFEDGQRLRFLTAEDIAARNAGLPKSATRTQLPNLAEFVPLGTYKFEARERAQKGEKSFHKIRAESKSKSRMLDARQRRRLHIKKALRDAGLYPRDDQKFRIKSDDLRVRLLEPTFEAHPHDLGRALYNALWSRGLMKPIGRRGEDEGSGFGKKAEEDYRAALEQFGCRTIGKFLDRCARDAKRDRIRFRKRHRPLADQRKDAKNKPKDLAAAKSYEVFAFLTPTFNLVREECRLLRDAQRANVSIPDEAWAKIEEAAEFRRSLKAKIPGWCEYFRKPHYRCVRALPSFQRLRLLEQISHLRDQSGRPLNDATFGAARAILERNEQDLLNDHGRITLAKLSRALGTPLKKDKDDETGTRFLVGARTDIALTEAFGEAWSRLPIDERDDWVMRFLRRHWPPEQGCDFRPWTESDEEALERDCVAAFGADALAKVDDEVAKKFEDKFSSMSVKAARLRAKCYAKRLSHEEMLKVMRDAGAPDPELALYEELPYYGAVMPDLVVPAEGFAPRERTVQEELDHGRAANPDVHIVMNRLRVLINEIIEMMGGILPTRCVIEMARSAFSEEQANVHSRTARARAELHEKIVAEIERVLGTNRPTGPALDKLVDRWKAAVRQGWRDYDGNRIQPSALVDGSVYQLDHVMPAAFGDFRENNMFVSRFNRDKGRRLPWEAFKEKADFRPALAAFATFGLQQQIKGLESALKPKPPRTPPKGERRKRLEESLERAKRDLDRLAEFDASRHDVLVALERTLTDDPDTLVAGDVDAESKPRKKDKGHPFRPGDQAALFRRFHPDRTRPESEPAARDVANIGWNTKLALRYVRHLGAEPEAIKAWAPYVLRCMFNINKDRTDLRNHAVDAFLVAHFDKYVLRPAFDRLRCQSYESLYETRALTWALDQVSGGSDLLAAFIDNLNRLDQVLCTIGTAHRADHRWNPGDRTGGSFGAIGGENIYSFRPTTEQRKAFTEIIAEAGSAPADGRIMCRKEILEFVQKETQDKKERKLQEKLKKKIQLRYRTRDPAEAKETLLNYTTALPLPKQPGAFIDKEGKFAFIGPSVKDKRRLLSVAEFSRMSVTERVDIFSDGRSIYRSGDTVIDDGKALVVTGLEATGQLKCFPVDLTTRKNEDRVRVTVPVDVKKPPIIKFENDVLGRRLHRLRKNPGGFQPVPYTLRGQ